VDPGLRRDEAVFWVFCFGKTPACAGAPGFLVFAGTFMLFLPSIKTALEKRAGKLEPSNERRSVLTLARYYIPPPSQHMRKRQFGDG
jgi:hypothetical protein